LAIEKHDSRVLWVWLLICSEWFLAYCYLVARWMLLGPIKKANDNPYPVIYKAASCKCHT